MRLIRLVTLPYVRRHGLRAALTVAGVALGVAVLVGIRTANSSVVRGFERTVAAIAGRTELQVSAGDAGVPEALLDRVRSLSVVRSASPAIEAVVQTHLRGEGNLLVLAVDLVGDSVIRDYDIDTGDAEIFDPLVFLAQPDSLIVARDFAARNGVGVGDRLSMSTMAGDRTFTVRGLARPGGMAAAFGGAIGVMDIYAAQLVFGRGRTFDRIDILTAEHTSLDAAQDALRRELGPAYAVETPARRGQMLQSLLAGLEVIGTVTSLFALLIGMFVIFSAFSTSVTERRQEIGILRALGATSSQVRRLFLVEGAVAGGLGSLAGVAGGWGAAVLIGGPLGIAAASLTGIQQPPADVALSKEIVLLGLLGGVLSSIAAAWLPARQAAQLDPARAIQKGVLYRRTARSEPEAIPRRRRGDRRCLAQSRIAG